MEQFTANPPLNLQIVFFLQKKLKSFRFGSQFGRLVLLTVASIIKERQCQSACYFICEKNEYGVEIAESAGVVVTVTILNVSEEGPGKRPKLAMSTRTTSCRNNACTLTAK